MAKKRRLKNHILRYSVCEHGVFELYSDDDDSLIYRGQCGCDPLTYVPDPAQFEAARCFLECFRHTEEPLMDCLTAQSLRGKVENGWKIGIAAGALIMAAKSLDIRLLHSSPSRDEEYPTTYVGIDVR